MFKTESTVLTISATVKNVLLLRKARVLNAVAALKYTLLFTVREFEIYKSRVIELVKVADAPYKEERSPSKVDVSCVELIYVAVPRPAVVLVRVISRAFVLV